MAEYQYRVVTPEGKEKKGIIEAKSLEQASALLKAQNNIVLGVESAGLMNKNISLSFGSSIKSRDYSVFCRQFVSIIGAGVSLINALEMMVEQTENISLKKGLQGIYEDVSKGESIAAAMRKRPKVFPGMFCNMVDAGESSGSLEKAFERMAIQFEKDTKLRQAVKKAMIYPIVLVFVMIGVILIMLSYVIPSFMGMFEDLETELPAITQLVVNMSDFIREKWWLLMLIVAAVVLIFKAYAGTSLGRLTIDRLKLGIPFFGELQKKTACAKFGRTLCTLLGAGVPMIDCMDITARSMDNIHYKKAMLMAKEQVASGIPLSRPLRTCGLFPPMVIHMVTIGEQTGNIETMLENAAEYYEDDVKIATEQMMALMEPMIIVVMAVVVGFLIFSILSPMFTLYESIG